MKNNYVLLSAFLVLNACTITSESPIDLLINKVSSFDVETKTKQYPYFPIEFREFGVRYETDIVTPENTTISIREKEIMLERLDFVRFVLNTPEFENIILGASVYSDRNISGSEGTIKSGEKFNNLRLLNVLQRNSHIVRIAKAKIAIGAAAQATLGIPIYVNKLAVNQNRTYTIEFPYREQWDTGGYLQENYISGLLLHELLHNMGFGHGNSGKPDPVYGIQGYFLAVVNDPSFKEKYSKQIASFKPFYATKHADLLQENTRTARSLSLDNLITYNIDEIIEVCIVYEDGTYEIRKMKNGQFI